MNRTEEEKQARKEALKRLRESRKQTIEIASRSMKEQKKAMDAIRNGLKEGARTVPELAEAAGMDSAHALWIVAALKKYGEIAEGEKDGGYFRYRLLGATE
jgi:methylphosphotriester-DNA--protein-cysteine methyltransferase